MSTKVTLVGRIGRVDPELRFTPSGKAVANFDMVTSQRRKNEQTQAWEDVNATWYRVTAWGDMGENVCEALHAGDAVIVHGDMWLETYDRQDGSKGAALKVNAWAVGPDLRWMTAKTNKAARNPAGTNYADTGAHPTGQTPAGKTDDPWATGTDAPF